MTPTSPSGVPQNGRHTEPAPSGARAAQNALGSAPNNGLLKASIQAGIGFAILFAGLTFGPYFWDKSQGAKASVPAPAAKPDAEQPAVAPPPSAPDPAASGKPPAGAPTAAGKPAGKGGDILDKLGENGTKTAPAKVNPLDKKADDILNDIK